MANTIYSSKFKTSTGEIIEAVEYIQSNGKEYIDTGVGYSNAIRFQLAFKQTRFNTTYHGICGWSTSTGYRYNSANDTTLRCGLRTQDWINFTVSSLDINILDSYYNGTTTYNGDTLSIPKGSSVPSGGLALFSYDATPTANQLADVMKVYYCKVWNGTTLVRDLVPVRIVTTNEYCLYDMENDVLYHNKGTGAFTGGPFKPNVLKTKVKHIYFPNHTVDYEGTEYELTQVDYLDAQNAVTWINTNMNTSANMNIRCIFRLDRTWANNSVIFGSDRYNNNAALFIIQSNKFCFYGSSPQAINTVLPTVGHTYDFSLTKVNNACTIIMKDLTTGTSITKTSTDSYNDKPIYIGHCSAVGSNTNPTTLLRFEVDNGTVHRNFVPVMMSGSPEYGLLDLVENKLYRNAGNGYFVGGDRTEVKKITELAGIDNDGVRYGKLNYLEILGGQRIDTGVLNKFNTRCEIDIEWTSNTVGESIMSVGGYRYDIFRNKVDYVTFRASNSQTPGGFPYDGQRRTYVHSSTGTVITGGDLTNEITITGYSYTEQNHEIYLFGGTAESSFVQEAKCYGVKMYYERTLIRDLVPALRPTDNVKGLFDRVNKIFYTNQGTGEFGGEVNYITFIDE